MPSCVRDYESSTSKEQYEQFYDRSDFKHFGRADKIFIKTLVETHSLKGLRLLDLGCGTGYYAHLFESFGVDVVGVDIAESGVQRTKHYFNVMQCLVGDGLSLPFLPGTLSAIFLSGFPIYNARDLSELSTYRNTLFSFLKPNGLFIFHKTTDLSGQKGTRMNHTLHALQQHFKSTSMFHLIGSYAVSPLSWMLMGHYALSPIGTKFCILFTKLTHIPLRALIILRKKT